MGKSSYGLLLLALFCLPSVPASALSVAGVFGNHAVLQQGVRVPVWGTAKEGSRVQVSFASQQLTTTADAEGQWMTWLGSMGASSKGRKLTIQSVNQRLEFENVVVGEVWLASGQSNMQWPLKSCASRLKEVKLAMEDKTNLGDKYWHGQSKDFVVHSDPYDSAYILPHKDYFLLGYFPQEIYWQPLHLPYAFLTQYTLFTLLLSA